MSSFALNLSYNVSIVSCDITLRGNTLRPRYLWDGASEARGKMGGTVLGYLWCCVG
jgi:hypothetical protein